MSISGIATNTKGVDVSDEDKNAKIDEVVKIAIETAKKYDTIIAITGKEDIVADKNNVYIIKNGVDFLSKITGTGCMSASLIGSFIGANQDKLLSTVIAISTMGIAGEIAYEKTKNIGSSSFRIALIDEISTMTKEKFEKFKKIQILK